MRAARCSRVVLFLALLPALAAPAAAQTPDALRAVCDVTVASERGTGDPLHPASVYGAFKPQIERNEWGVIAQALADDLRGAGTTDLTADQRARFQRQLDAFASEMKAVEASANTEQANAKGVSGVRFRVETDVNTSGYTLFLTTGDRIDIAPATPIAQAKELCYRAYAAGRILVRYAQPGRERTASVLGHYVTLWDNFNKQGYSQYPWELFLNGLWTIKPSTLVPPRSQWVLLHPAVAIEVSAPQIRDFRRLDIISIEPLGYLRYSSDRRSYGGVSLLVTLSATADPGYGLLAHFGKTGKLGYTYHPRDVEGRSRHGVVFSIDLYKLIAGVPQKLQDVRTRIEGMRDALIR
jgi:hypothetical protein